MNAFIVIMLTPFGSLLISHILNNSISSLAIALHSQIHYGNACWENSVIVRGWENDARQGVKVDKFKPIAQTWAILNRVNILCGYFWQKGRVLVLAHNIYFVCVCTHILTVLLFFCILCPYMFHVFVFLPLACSFYYCKFFLLSLIAFFLYTKMTVLEQIYNEYKYKSQMGLHSFGRMTIEFATYTFYTQNIQHMHRPIEQFIETKCFYKDIIFLWFDVFCCCCCFIVLFPLSQYQSNSIEFIFLSNVHLFTTISPLWVRVFYLFFGRCCHYCYIEFLISCHKIILSCVMWKLFIFIV